MTIFYNDEFLEHMQSPFHPESPERLRGIVQRLRQHGLWSDVNGSRTASMGNIRLVHEDDYIDFIRTCGECNITLDTIVHNETYEIAALSAECAVDAALYSRKERAPTFALTRPPGHHAGRDYGLGFCYFNNISIAASRLMREGDRKVAIVDVDVHHGNGTQEIFADDPNVLYVSIHQTGIFPGTGCSDFIGMGDAEGTTVNIPLQSGCGDSTYDLAHREIVTPIVEQFEPDAMLVSWGMDTHYRDPLASMALSSEGQVREAIDLIKLSENFENRITFMLEGGYDIPSLSEVVAAVIGHARGIEIPLLYTDILDSSYLGRGTIDRMKKTLAKRWDL